MPKELPVVIQLDRAQSIQYHRSLNNAMKRTDYAGHEHKYGHPVALHKDDARELKEAAEAIHDIVVRGIEKSGGITEWMTNRAPVIGSYPLNNFRINGQLEDRLNQGFHMPVVYDVILSLFNGKPIWRTVEVQSGVGYSTEHIELLSAAGFEPSDTICYEGSSNPLNVLSELKNSLSGGDEIVVIDIDPLEENLPDEVGMAKILGSHESLPISIFDVEEDRQGYYAHPYVSDQKSGMPIKDESGLYIKDSSKKLRLEHVLSRMVQSSLNEVFARLPNLPNGKTLQKFLDDSNLDWIWHPTWQYIIDKSTMPLIWKVLAEEGSPYSHHFVPVFSAREYVTPGTYVKKPTTGESGVGQSIVRVGNYDNVMVEDGYTYQQQFIPYPLKVSLPDHLAGTFRIPRDIPLHLTTSLRWSDKTVPGTLEVRFMPPPYCRNELSGWFMSRFAPRWLNPSISREFTKTNQAKITSAIWQSPIVTNENHYEYPFGWCPVIIKR